MAGYQNEYFGTICEGKKGILRCPGTKTITVKFANYGRSRVFKCGMGFNTKCRSETSLKITRHLTLTVPSVQECKSAPVNVELSRSPENKMLARYSSKKYYTAICQNKTGEVKCPGTQTINLLFANYGRRHLLKCGIGLNVKCISIASHTTVRLMCDGKNSCSLHASNDVFGNPCRLTPKYLELYWECQQSTLSYTGNVSRYRKKL
ncbi:hypothetical protein ACROYT_G008105 [Oculina patagonica]